MSSEKVIDVMEGDEFGADSYLCQIRRGMFRNFYANSVSGWSKGGRLAENSQLRPVAMNDALLILRMAGYKISFGEGEKPAPLTFMDDLVERTEKPADVPEVAELWGRIHVGSGKIRVYASKAFAIKAQAGCRDADWVVMDHPLQPAPKPAARVVKLPEMPGRFVDEQLVQGWNSCIAFVTKALVTQGFTVADEGSST
jgi:hypothetical protein